MELQEGRVVARCVTSRLGRDFGPVNYLNHILLEFAWLSTSKRGNFFFFRDRPYNFARGGDTMKKRRAERAICGENFLVFRSHSWLILPYPVIFEPVFREIMKESEIHRTVWDRRTPILVPGISTLVDLV